jgi:hypothetical protein
MAENSVIYSVQPGRNGGTLRRGNKGNKGGRGRSPEALRQDIRKAAPMAIQVLQRFVTNEGKDIEPRLQLRAAEFVFTASVPPLTGVPRDEVIAKLRESLNLLREQLPDPEATLMIARMRKIWA